MIRDSCHACLPRECVLESIYSVMNGWGKFRLDPFECHYLSFSASPSSFFSSSSSLSSFHLFLLLLLLLFLLFLIIIIIVVVVVVRILVQIFHSCVSEVS